VSNELGVSEIVIGSGIEITTQQILFQVLLGMGIDPNKFKFTATDPKPSDPKKVVLDSSLFQELTNWKPNLTLDRQIRKIIHNLNLKKEFSVRLHH
jgi:nucleoside-diphosphate-sugar epimerase